MLEQASVGGYDWGMPREMLDTSILDVALPGREPNGEAHTIYAEEILADFYRMVGVVNRLDDAGDFTEERITTLTNMIKQPDSFIVHAAMLGLFKLYGVLDDYYELGEDRPRG